MPRFPHVSETTTTLSARVYSQVAARIRPGQRVHRLNVGDTWREPLPQAMAEAQLTADHPLLHTYAPPHGHPLLLEAIAERHRRVDGVDLPAEAIQVTAGATVGLSVIVQSLVSPGDEVIVLSPYWPLIRGIVASRGATAVQLPFWTHLSDPEFDPEGALSAAITDKTVAIYVNSPNNPTGVVCDDATADAIARVAARFDLWVLSDETYADIYLGDERPQPFWTRENLRDRTIAAFTCSKAYGLAGSRVGWITGPVDSVRTIRDVHTFQVYGAPKPLQIGAARALLEGEEWLAQSRAYYREAAKKAAEVFPGAAPAGSTFMFFDSRPWLPPGAETCLPFLEAMVDGDVLMVPGGASGQDFPTWVRVCFTCVPPAELDEALEKAARVFDQLSKG